MQAVGLVNFVHLFEERDKHFLKDLARLVFVKTRAPRNGVNEALVTVDKDVPGPLVAMTACDQQLFVSGLHADDRIGFRPLVK